MSSQAQVHSIESLREFRAALALYGEDVLAALGAADAEIRRTIQWLQQDRPYFWQEQIKRRRERVAAARAELFRLKLQKTPEHHPSLAVPKEQLRLAEASLHDAEKRLILVRKWQPAFQQAVIEYHGAVQRLKDMAASDVPRAMDLLVRIVDALESYLSVQPPSGDGSAAFHDPGPSEVGGLRRAGPEMEALARVLIEKDEVDASNDPSKPEESQEDD